MLSKPTTFILGAGASCDFQFPTGDGLQDRIMGHLQLGTNARQFSSEKMWKALIPLFQGNGWSQRAGVLAGAARRISKGMPIAASIDNFLHTHQGDEDVVLMGKIAIALSIIEAEADSPLAIKGQADQRVHPLTTEHYRKSWYHPFMRMLTMGTQSNDPHALCRNLRFVVFNYDRCLELVLLHTLQGYYGLNADDAQAVFADIEIIHPYGSIGKLTSSQGGGVPFGYQHADILDVASGIKTFTESVDEQIVSQARAAVEQADTLVFLGFGFLPQNMDLLRPRETPQALRVHATTFGVSASDRFVIHEQLRHFVKAPNSIGRFEFVTTTSSHDSLIDVDNGVCRELIENHRMRLAA
ncbi:MAG: hypothetical protein CL949_01845 [Erythrobacter sp.]|nr:hypothetical protein [Erythrobacter sp.]|tara:strand:+ start:3234 stop:4298 length:1065 start_codon:yes stop_codon:yes gene_type:complete